MERGTVKWFDPTKKYGFIVSDTKEEYFVHTSDIEGLEGCLEKGQRVEFQVEEGKKGPLARSVKGIV